MESRALKHAMLLKAGGYTLQTEPRPNACYAVLKAGGGTMMWHCAAVCMKIDMWHSTCVQNMNAEVGYTRWTQTRAANDQFRRPLAVKRATGPARPREAGSVLMVVVIGVRGQTHLFVHRLCVSAIQGLALVAGMHARARMGRRGEGEGE